MGKVTVQELIIERLDRMETKLDTLVERHPMATATIGGAFLTGISGIAIALIALFK